MSNVKVHRSIKKLIDNSNKGDIKSTFQLAEYYETGKFVEENKEKSKELYGHILRESKNFNLKLRNIKLNNYKQFNSLSIDFDNKVTVFVGNNGSGKTTVIESASKSLSWLIARIKNENGIGTQIDEKEINAKSEIGNCTITSTMALKEDLIFSLSLSRTRTGSHKKLNNDLEDLSILGDIYRYTNEHLEEDNLPTLAYYSVLRSIELDSRDFSSAEKIANTKNWGKFDGYDSAIDGKYNFGTFLGWLIRYSNISNQENKSSVQINKKIKQLESELKAYKIAIKHLESAENKIISGHLELQAIRSLIDEKTIALNKAVDKTNSNKITPKILVEYVQTAICKFIPELNNIRVYHSEEGVDLLVDKGDVTLSVSQLSHGERTLMALVGDIARRMVLLNPSRKNPLDGDGILIIDEIDMHLHPEWQQKVIKNLTNTFKNVQFIITTHSPQVLSSISRKNVRMLEKNSLEEFIAATPAIETYGHSNADVMQGVMRVSPTPTLKKEDEALLEEYKKLIEQGDLYSPRVHELKIMLVKIFGSEHRELIRLEMVRRRREALE